MSKKIKVFADVFVDADIDVMKVSRRINRFKCESGALGSCNFSKATITESNEPINCNKTSKGYIDD